MGLRPVAARWFQMLCPQDEVARAVEALARTGHVQIEPESGDRVSTAEEIQDRLDAFAALERRYGAFFSDLAPGDEGCDGSPAEILDRGLRAIEAFVADADPIIARAKALEVELGELALIAELLEAAGDDLPDLARFASEHTLLEARILALPPDADEPALPSGVVRRGVEGQDHLLFLVVGPRRARADIERAAEAAHARHVALPRDLPPDAAGARAAVDTRARDAREELDAARAELEALAQRHGVEAAVRAIRRLDWYARFVPPSRETRNFSVVTGFCDAPREALQDAVDAAGLHALVTTSDPPPGHEPPMVLRNAWWVRPFELFARLVGVPAAGEVDPSALLSVIAPLLFGYMFGDVGQGAVLLVAGLALRRRVPSLALLVPGGISAIAFGLLFGTVFTLEDVIPPLWIHPMEEPLTLLGASVAAGAAIMLLGLGLSGLAAAYRRQLGRFLRTDAAIVAMYVGSIGMLADVRAGFLALAALAWFLFGHVSISGIGRALAELGELVERVVQLVVNTVSFARVGAFALAHAGLSEAVVGMAEDVGAVGSAIVLVVGNVLIVLVEGLVASIQTTRLVLFEFFARFLEARGRAFIPLLPPAMRTRP